MANQNQKTEEGKALEDYTVAELRAMADEKGIEIPSHATKDEIIKALEKAGVTAAPSGEAGVTPLALTGPVLTLPLSDITADSYGIGKKYNIQLADFQAFGAASGLNANFLLDNFPAGAIVQLARIKHSQAFVSPSITACTAQVGDGTNLWGTTLDITTAVAAANLSTAQLTANNVGPMNAVYPVYLILAGTGAGGNIGAATAGAVSVWLRYTLLGSA